MATEILQRRLFIVAGLSSISLLPSAFAQEDERRQIYAGNSPIERPGAVFQSVTGRVARRIGAITTRLRSTRVNVQGSGNLRFDQLSVLLGVRPSATAASQYASIRVPVQARATNARSVTATQPAQGRQEQSIERSLRTIVRVDDHFFEGRYYFVRETTSAERLEVVLTEGELPPEILTAILESLAAEGLSAQRYGGTIRINVRRSRGGAVFVGLDEIQLRSMGAGPGSADFDLIPANTELDFA